MQTDSGRLDAVVRAGRTLGVRVVSRQDSLDTLVVEGSTAQLDALRAVPGVRVATPDMRVHLSGTSDGHGRSATDMRTVAAETGATAFWRRGFYGQDVDVALLDSGVLPVKGLTGPNKLVIGPDLSFEARSRNLVSLDTFGHGTHMAGIIAGLDDGTTPDAYESGTGFVGMAPQSRIISIKLADAHGQTDVSQVMAAIDWVVAHAHDPGLNIRVLNLSFGTDSTQDYRIDPLAHAAEVAWANGIVVVVAAGNRVSDDGGLADPAYDPAVLAVGALDDRGTASPDDDALASFSQQGKASAGRRGPDLVAPGTSLLSLRAPGSFVDSTFGSTGLVGDRFFRGSGTSQAAAVVSGAAALVLSQHPNLTPDQVRDLLRRGARPLPHVSTDGQGAGAVNLSAAVNADVPAAASVPTADVHAGGGSLEAARGRFHVHRGRALLSGERDAFGRSFDAGDVAVAERRVVDGPFGWLARGWRGAPERGASWDGSGWRGATWAGATWAGATWAGATWAGASWADTDWDGATWAGASWDGATWAGATWAGASWADADWANDVWASESWE